MGFRFNLASINRSFDHSNFEFVSIFELRISSLEMFRHIRLKYVAIEHLISCLGLISEGESFEHPLHLLLRRFDGILRAAGSPFNHLLHGGPAAAG